MLKVNKSFIQVVVFAVVGILFVVAFSDNEDAGPDPAVVVVNDPLNATFVIDGHAVTLSGGSSSIPTENSSNNARTSVFGTPVQGDLDVNGLLDTVMILVPGSGGSGTSYYVAAVMNSTEGYTGTNAIYLGDRIAPQTLLVENGLIIVNYATRENDASFSEEPTIAETLYVLYEDGQLSAIDSLGEGEMIFSGYYSMGHEVRGFQACDGQEYFIHGDSAVYQDMQAVYAEVSAGQGPYIPQPIIMVAKIVDAPAVGFAEDYDYALLIDEIVRYPGAFSCRPQTIFLNEPKQARVVGSPLHISGFARGPWFFEGDFPVILTDWDGQIIAEHYVTATDDWMTENLVRFEGDIEFESLEGGRGSLILHKDNPSGLPEHNDALEIPIWFD